MVTDKTITEFSACRSRGEGGRGGGLRGLVPLPSFQALSTEVFALEYLNLISQGDI